VATNFGVNNIGEYRSTAAVPLVSSIVLPDGSQYSFTYEATPGTCIPLSFAKTLQGHKSHPVTMLQARPHAIHFKRILDFGEGQALEEAKELLSARA
jgi:hypothetical protein